MRLSSSDAPAAGLRPRWRGRAAGSLFYVLPILLIGFLVVAAILNGLAYVRNFVDDTGYHIPMSVEIARHQNPYYVDTSAAFVSFWFPAGAESLIALLLTATHDIRVTNLSGALFFALFLWVAYHFAGIWTRDRLVRLLCVVMVASIPVLLAQTRAFYVDIQFGFLIFLSLYLFARAVTSGEANYAYLGLGTTVLSAGVKYHGLVAGAVLIPAGVLCAWLTRDRRIKWTAVVVVLACLVFTSGWYVRNLVLKGNPVYPLALPAFLESLSEKAGLPYDGIDFPNMSPKTHWPQPLIPLTVANYEYRPDVAGDAFGLVFPVSLAMIVLGALRAPKMPALQRRAFWITAGAAVAVVAVLPFHLSVPRYVLFLPALAAMGPAILAAALPDDLRVRRVVMLLVLALSLFYVGANLVDDGAGRTLTGKAIRVLAEGRPSGIVNLPFVEQGNLRIGYLGGRFAFIAALYDRKLTNQLIQLHYRDYLLDHGTGPADEGEFVRYVKSLNLDYICVFDASAPGAELLRTAFPEKTFVIDAANSSPDYLRYRL